MFLKQILLVEDEPIIRTSVAESLRGEGYLVLEAGDGASALAQFQESTPDLILLDIMLPGISGIEVCRLIRTKSTTPIILLTARDAETDKVLGLEVGADDYITKPFSLRELNARIRAVLRRMEKSSTQGDSVHIGDLKIDLAGHQILKRGEVLSIKPQAFRLLAFLLRNPGQVFSREQLLLQAWGSDYPGETRTVDVHVHAIRDLIERDPAHPRILETVRGVGYVYRPAQD